MKQSSGAVALLFAALLSASCAAWAADKARNLAVKTNNAVVEQRIALVIGNGAYINSPLKNPVNDARDMASKLRRLGFDVVERHNLQTRQIGGTLREFRSKLAPGAVALVFYAGHGLQIKGDNYLPAVDADINSEEDVPNQSLAVRQIMDVLDESRTRLNLVFLDACRNNPYARSFRSADRGLARVSAPSGTLISYATRPGNVAADGGGRNGLYTSKLLRQMDSNLQIELVLKRVVGDVKAASQGRQEPWMEGSIEGNFCFVSCGRDGETTSGSNSLDTERVFWEGISNSRNADDFKSYMEQYPQGVFVELARQRLKRLEAGRIAMARPGALPADPSATERDLRLEAEDGDANAMYKLAVLLRDRKNYAESNHWMIEAAGQGNSPARASVGWRYRDAQGQWRDDAGFEQWCREAAAGGNAEAMFVIGRAYHVGNGAKMDYAQAMAWYQRAADAGSAPAMNNIGALYASGSGVARDDAQAMAWYQKAADAGYALAMNNVGVLYRDGLGVSKDYAQAMAWHRKAHDAGNSYGTWSIGALYYQGLGVAQDYSQALAWYQKAADAGNAYAMNSIGSIYYHGVGVTRDYLQALAWFQKAADVGNADGMAMVGVYYSDGLVVQKDRETARTWLKRAAEKGSELAKNKLKELFNE